MCKPGSGAQSPCSCGSSLASGACRIAKEHTCYVPLLHKQQWQRELADAVMRRCVQPQQARALSPCAHGMHACPPVGTWAGTSGPSGRPCTTSARRPCRSALGFRPKRTSATAKRTGTSTPPPNGMAFPFLPHETG